MILGVGNDVVEIERVKTLLARFGERFEARCFTAQERAFASARGPRKGRTLALRFAAKEAASKALGTGFREGMRLIDIEVVSDEVGKPALVLHGAALARLHAITPEGHAAQLHLALSDEGEFAWAVAVIEAVRA